MNERIRPLYYECQDESQSTEECYQKFALLMIQDNIRTLRSNGYDDAAQCLQDIYFGVDYPV
jgi:hypothetical protein